MKLWDLGTGACEQTLAGHDGVVTSVALSADGHRALSGSDDRMVKLWDLETGELLRTLGPGYGLAPPLFRGGRAGRFAAPRCSITGCTVACSASSRRRRRWPSKRRNR